MLLQWLESCAVGLCRQARRSRFFAVLAGETSPKSRERFLPPGGMTSGRHRRVLYLQEESRIRTALRRLFLWMTEGSLSSVGVMLLIFGGISLCGGLLREELSLWSLRLWLPVAVILSAGILLPLESSCSSALRFGLIGWFLRDFCGLSELQTVECSVGRERRLFSLLLGSLLGVLGLLWHPAVVLFLLLGSLAAALLFAVPELSLLLLLAGFPWIELTPHPSLALAGMLAVCDAVWLGKAISGKRQFSGDRRDFSLFLLAGLLAAGSVGRGGSGLLQGFLLLSAWIVISAVSPRGIWPKRCLGSFLASSAAVAGIGIWQYLSGRAELRWMDLSRFSDTGGRVCSVFSNPNFLAMYLVITVGLSLGGAVGCSGAWSRRACVACGLLSTLCLILTWSRGAWLAWGIVILLFLLLYSRQSLAILLILPLPSLLLSPYLPQNIKNRFLSIGSMRETSVKYRMESWQGVLRMIADRPWGIGCGEAAFRQVYPQYAVPGTETLMHAHQLLLQITVELGIPGLLLFFFILWYLLVGCVRFFRRQAVAEKRAMALAWITATSGCLVMGLFDDIWYNNGLFFLFWLLLIAGKNTVWEDAYV